MSETMTNEWPAIRSDYLKAMSAIEQRFQSGNEIPVPDARITRAEWEALDRYSLEDEARSTDAGMAYMHLEEERDALRAEVERLRNEERVERCESGDPACGPVEFHDSEGVPLCKACWDALVAENGAQAQPPAERGEG